MKSEPAYVSQTQRLDAAWLKASEVSGLPVDVLKEMFFTSFCVLGGGDFRRCVASGKFTPEYLLKGKTLAHWQEQVAASEVRRKNDPTYFLDEDPDDSDRLMFGLKQLVEIGDEWECEDTKNFLSGGEYLTKGKRYRIVALEDQGFGNFSLMIETNFPAPDNRTWTSCFGVRRLFREGKLIWAWKAAWVRDWNEHNSNTPFPCEPDDLALFAELGWPTPALPVAAK